MNDIEYRKMYEAEDSHWWYASLHELVLSVIMEECGENALDIFDAGCGTGRLCQLMSACGRVSGCDVSESALKFCRRRNPGPVFLADMNTVVLESGGYDVITSIDVICHAQIKDDMSVLRKFYDALKPGGILVLNLPAYKFLGGMHDMAVHTERRYSRPALVSSVSEAGFSVEKATYRMAFLFLPVLCFRSFQRLFFRRRGHGEITSDVFMLPAAVNRLLLAVARLENFLVKRWPLPFGTSVFVVGRKPS